MTFGTTLGEYLTMAVSANTFYIAINFKKKTNVKVADSNTNIKMHQSFSKQRILGFPVTIVQREILLDLARTCS